MTGKRFAVLIASSRFPNELKLDPLRFPENDADGLGEILRSEERGNFTQTVVLKNELRDKVIREIHKVLKEARKDDLVLMYYSGHGKLNEHGHLYLTTTDTEISLLESSAIPMETIKRLTDTSLSNKKVIILDCCFSGAAGDVFTRGGVDDQLQMMSKGRGTYLMTASTGIETAIERTEDQYGVFTKHLIGGIRSGEADRNNDGFITIDELYDYVHERVCAEACQEPMKWGLNVRGELVIAKSGKTPKEDRRRQIRKMLLELGNNDILPDKILADALAVNTSADECAERPECIGLLNQLADKKMKVGDFILEWHQLTVKTKLIPKVEVVSPKIEEVRKEIKIEPAPKPTVQKPKYQLRKEPVTTDDPAKAFNLKKDKDGWFRPLEYIQNDFKDNGDGTIGDHATGLMWQKSGSPDYLYLKDVPAYIERLNREKFAGYSDWRLPTLDELKSLLTQEKQSNDLYINPIFDKTQLWCWTSDKRASGGAWYVYFSYGGVYWFNGNVGCVRAVRSRQ